MSKGTIIYIGGFELPDKNAAAQRVVGNAKLLREIGFQVILIGMHKESDSKILEDEFYGFKSYSLHYPKSQKDWLKYLAEFKFYKKIIEENKNVHSLIFYNLPSFSMARLIKYSKKRNIKTFSDCTEWYVTPDKKSIKNFIKDIDIKLRMFHYHKKITGVISISKYLNDYYEKQKVNTFMLPPLVDLKDEKWNQSMSKNENRNKIRFAYVGIPFAVHDLSYVKLAKDRIDLIIENLYQFYSRGEDFIFNIIGLTKENFLRAYPDFESKLKEMNNIVIFNGKLPHLESIKLLTESNYSIFFREDTLMNNAGFPTKFVEAISASTAVITNESSNISDFLVDGKNGFLLRTRDIENIDNVMQKVFNLSKEDQEIIEKYTKKNNGIFDYRNYINPMSKFIEA